MRRHTPTRSLTTCSGSYATTCLRGQKPRRPPIVSIAGSSVRPAASTQATPIAATGPSDLIEPFSASSSTSIDVATVSPLASIAGPVRVSACAIASCLSWYERSSSR